MSPDSGLLPPLCGFVCVQRVKPSPDGAAMRALRSLLVLTLLIGLPIASARAQSPERYSSHEILDSRHRLFGGVSRGLASVVERAFSTWGQPNGYILGQEGGGAFIGGLRYGEGTLYTKNAGDLKVYWQGRKPRRGVRGEGDAR